MPCIYRITKLTVLFSCCTLFCTAQSRYNFVYEKQLGQHYAAEYFNAQFHLIDYADSLLLPKRVLPLETRGAKLVNPFYRLTKLFFTNYLITDYAMTMSHERFGHGYRGIESGGGIQEIKYNLPPPFTNQFSYISLYPPPESTPQQALMVNLGGSETNLVLTDVMRKNILLDQRFNYTYTLAYLYGSNDMPGYTAFITNPNSDPNRYRNNLNEFYGTEGDEPLTLERMRRLSFAALFTDPLNFYALKSVFYDYIIRGKHSSHVGMIPIGERLKFLPRFRFEYTPYGPELVYQGYFKMERKLMQFSFSHNDPELPDAWRLSANLWNITCGNTFSFNVSTQLWDQPEITVYNREGLQRYGGLGGLLLVTSNWDFDKHHHLFGLTLQLGYKTGGYALGEKLDEGLLGRVGFTFKLGGNTSQMN